ncbi:MAG: hypothetical protein HQM04_04495 [Magnetococcales bacterium]|nr:hypothetical protein [Magnetococcales bacterium]MBF0114284.1 hypothetical protein [Magnetococcales bacterium]
MTKKLLLVATLSLLMTGCVAGIPKEALQLQAESLANRQMQTRVYETSEELKILAAGTALLQDLGFTLAESETKLGVVTGIKHRDARDAGQVTMAVFVALFGGGAMPIDKEQTMRVSLVTRPLEGKRIAVRVTFQRTVMNTHNQITTQEAIITPEVYTEFFDKLSKAIFLEAHQI